MQDFFDRKTFDPSNNKADRSTLTMLRHIGARRMKIYKTGQPASLESTALEWALKTAPDRHHGLFLDLGCGDSPDALLMNRRGFTSYGLDLFPPDGNSAKLSPQYFIRADVAEWLPYDEGSVDIAVSQAMLDLIEPVAREQFFREVDRVLKPGGIFSCYIQWLQSGWGFDLQEEQDRARKIWPNLTTKPQGFIVTKEIPNE